MDIQKSNIINFLFLLSFPFYGIGKYMAQVGNFSIGQTISILPLLLIIIFYTIDLFTKKEFKIKFTQHYFLLLAFALLNVLSFYAALQNGYPGSNTINTITLSLVALTIAHGALIVQFYNSSNPTFSITTILYWGLTLDIFINLAGYAVGLRNPIHSIEGRLNLPFGQGFYSTANTVAIVNLLIIGMFIHGTISKPFKLFIIPQFILNLYLMMSFNSRLSIMIFSLIVLLYIVRGISKTRFIYFISLFTIPLLLSFAELIYTVLQIPVLNQILQRVSYKDVTGFNGRRDLWERGVHWFITQGKGFFFGNGYHGYYTIGLINDLEEAWFRSAVNLHMHSSVLEYLLSVGVLGTMCLMIVLYITLKFIKQRIDQAHNDGILLGVFIYMLFLFQIDNYIYITNFGALILITIISAAIVKKESKKIYDSYNDTPKNINRYGIV